MMPLSEQQLMENCLKSHPSFLLKKLGIDFWYFVINCRLEEGIDAEKSSERADQNC